MKEYIIKGPVCNTIYRRYNKQYCTPPIYTQYEFNWILFVSGILSSIIFALFPDEYYYIFWIEAAFGLSFLINAIVIKTAFTSGVFDACLSKRSKMFMPTKIMAYTSQICFYQMIIPFVLMFVNNIDYLSSYTPMTIAASIIIVIANVAAPFGIGCQKYYNKNAQQAYSYIIEGPSRANETVETIYKSLDMEPMRALKHYDMATYKYFEARDIVSRENVELRKIIDHYDTSWRYAVIYGEYMYAKKMPLQTPKAKELMQKMICVNDEIKKMNLIIDTINAKEYIPKTKSTCKSTVATKPTKPTTKPDEKNDNVQTPIVVDVVWNHRVNWY